MSAILDLPRIPLREPKFCAWLAQAEPGDTLEYHRGFLVIDREELRKGGQAEALRDLIRVGDRAMRLAEQGLIHLVQRRLGADRFSYLAIARPRRKRAALSFSTLFVEGAA